MTPKRLVWVVGAVAALGLACASILDIQPLSYAPDAGFDAGARDAADAAEEPVTCTPLHPPRMPDAGDDDGGTDFTLAMSSLVAGITNPDQVDNYFDLDNVCTCAIPNAESCARVAPDGSAAPAETCDLSQGRDATLNRTISSLLQGFPGFSDVSLSEELATGNFGALISVRGYNGQKDDSKIRVDFAGSYGCGTVSAGKLTMQPPKFDGNDPWTIDPFVATASGNLLDSKFVDPAAYVSGGVLVAHLPLAVVYLQFKVTNGNQLALRFTDAIVSGTLVPSGSGSFSLSAGRFTGRVTPADAAKAFSAWNDSLDEATDPIAGICPPSPPNKPTGSTVFKTIQASICDRVDLRNSAAADGKGLPCNAGSFGIGLTASPAIIGDPYAYIYKATSCFDGGVYDPIGANAPTICPQ